MRSVYAAPSKRGHSKNGRGGAPQIVSGLAVTRDGLPVRHWVFPGNTVDATIVARVKEDLGGWQLTRRLFDVGRALFAQTACHPASVCQHDHKKAPSCRT